MRRSPADTLAGLAVITYDFACPITRSRPPDFDTWRSLKAVPCRSSSPAIPRERLIQLFFGLISWPLGLQIDPRSLFSKARWRGSRLFKQAAFSQFNFLFDRSFPEKIPEQACPYLYGALLAISGLRTVRKRYLRTVKNRKDRKQ